MTKTQIKAMLMPQLTALTAANAGIASSKWARAKAITEIYEMINWAKTPYKSFKNFVDEELKDLCYETCNLWKTHYRKVLKFKYTQQELDAISAKVSYALAVIVLTAMVRKLTVSSFINRAHTLRTSTINYRAPGNYNVIHITLPDSYMAKLENILSGFGFTRSKRGLRQNVNSSFIKFLDTL